MKSTLKSASMSLGVMFAVFLAVNALAVSNATEFKLNAADADFDDRLGQAVAISGNVAIAGANRNDDHGSNSGSAYLFDATTGQQLFKLTASNAQARDLFGHSVAISGNTALIGGFGADRLGDQSGVAYLFDVTTGNELFQLLPSDGTARDYFGHGVGIDGNRAIVGSHGDDDKGGGSGSAYIFDVATGQELMKLTASDGAAHDEFGYWTAISGNIAIVGAKYDDHAGFRSGSAYLFDVTTGQELMKLTASDASSNAEFGYAVAIDGNTAVVGAYGDKQDTGAVYVYDVTTGAEIRKISASDGERGDWFGYSLGISGSTVFVGAYNDDDDGTSSGSSYLYDLELGNELYEQKITASDAAANDEFGTAVGISGNHVVAGAWQKDTASGMDTGQAYTYDISSILPWGPDFNQDGSINEADLVLWQDSFSGPLYDANGDGLVNDEDYQIWEENQHNDIPFVDSPANLNQEGPVGGEDLVILQQAYGLNNGGDIDGDGDTDGADFLFWLRAFTPFEAADANHDRVVDELDLELWTQSNGYTGLYDADGDGDSDGRDFLIWQRRFTQAANSNTNAIPEPSSLLIGLIGLIALLQRVR
ncbi:hypothetical protein [Bythopirellula goksoeyrii]|uniref:YciI-like protein n=1 Tax=Bythopirellula goksoeyrii TaxID=1400387 RepID=A0A5B9Q6U0_9BACT|nr:hypothetical protein [Bythopirellula goksoeyrii]QEG34707.1 YciI-like protein [Bythopirellula goksoeyrii]